MEFKINAQERALLSDVLERSLAEARAELHHTDSHEWRNRLRGDEEKLRALLERLRRLGGGA